MTMNRKVKKIDAMGKKNNDNVENCTGQGPGTSTYKEHEGPSDQQPGPSCVQSKSRTRNKRYAPGSVLKSKTRKNNIGNRKVMRKKLAECKRSRSKESEPQFEMKKDEKKTMKERGKTVKRKVVSMKKTRSSGGNLQLGKQTKIESGKRASVWSGQSHKRKVSGCKSVNLDHGSSNISNGKKRKRSDDDDNERVRKRSRKQKPTSRTQEPVSMTTRLMNAKKVGVTLFTFDNVCNCGEKEFSIFINSVRIKSCPCGKRFEQFMRLVRDFGSDADTDSVCKKQKRAKNGDYFNLLSIEMICYIFKFLTLKEILRFESLSKKLQKAVRACLSVREEIDFHEDFIDRRLFKENLPTLTDYMFTRLLEKSPRLRYIYNFHPVHVALLSSMNKSKLTAPGVCDAIMACKSLEGIEISNMVLLEHLVSRPSHPRIIGKFQNRDQRFPVLSVSMTALKDESNITNLHLVGCSLYHLPEMDNHLEHLYLRMVKFVHPNPFKNFSAMKLKTFVMSHCVGPTSSLKYISLLRALACARGLKRLELQRVPFLGEVIQHVCENNWQDGGFRRLNSITMGQCKNAVEADLGFLIIAAAAHLESLRIQPSLTKDSLFSALAISDVRLNPGFEELSLGWQEPTPFDETMTPEEQVVEGLAELPESQSRLTDSGMRLVGQCFPPLKKLEIMSCPHLINPLLWITPGQLYLRQIRELTLQDCHGMRIENICAFLTFLPELRYLTLSEVFKEPPLGCSRVGLSAGTGLGMSSAFINPHPGGNNAGAQNDNEAAENNRNQAGHEAQGQGNNRAHRNRDGEFEIENGRYNLRGSARRASSHSDHEPGPSRQARTRRSTRRSNGARNVDGAQSDNFQENCDTNNSVTRETSSANGSSSDIQRGRGKALVTKNGIVSRVKSSKGKECSEVSEAKEEKVKVKKICTCVKQHADATCQASSDDIRKTIGGKNVKRRSSSRNTKNQENVIRPGKYKPAAVNSVSQPSPQCQKHPFKRYRPEMADKCDSTNDPVWEEDHKMVLTILHRRLEYLKIDAVGITELNILCYNLQTLSISRCRVLQDINLKEAPFLENVHVSQCRKVHESSLLDEIYKLPPNKSKFVSLRPMHFVDEYLFHDRMLYDDLNLSTSNYGTVMLFDHSDQPSKTNYNKMRMKSWNAMLTKMTTNTIRDYGWQLYGEMESPQKYHSTMEGKSCDGSKWEMLADTPWINVLNQCPDMEDANIKDQEWKKAGVLCMEAKGHFSFSDAYLDVLDFIHESGPDKYGLFECNVLTYINMCDTSGVPCKDALSIL